MLLSMGSQGIRHSLVTEQQSIEKEPYHNTKIHTMCRKQPLSELGSPKEEGELIRVQDG